MFKRIDNKPYRFNALAPGIALKGLLNTQMHQIMYSHTHVKKRLTTTNSNSEYIDYYVALCSSP